MKQGNAAIQTKQVKQISVFRAWWPLRQFSRYVSWSMAFFVYKSFNSGAQGRHKWVLLELGKCKKGRLIINLLVILPLFKRCASRYSRLNSFHRPLFAVEQRVFGCLIGFD